MLRKKYKEIIDNHNRKLLNNIKSEQNKHKCNRRIKTACPLEGNYMAENIVYLAKTEVEN